MDRLLYRSWKLSYRKWPFIRCLLCSLWKMQKLSWFWRWLSFGHDQVFRNCRDWRYSCHKPILGVTNQTNTKKRIFAWKRKITHRHWRPDGFVERTVIIIDLGIESDHSVRYIWATKKDTFNRQELRMVWFSDFFDGGFVKNDIDAMYVSNNSGQNKTAYQCGKR